MTNMKKELSKANYNNIDLVISTHYELFRSGALVKNKEVLMKEKERLMAELLVAKGKLTKANRYEKDLENKCDQAEKKIAEYSTQIEVCKLFFK